MEGDSEHMLKWNSHDEFLVDVFKNYRKSNKFTNVTLLAQGKFFEAHQCILASCSEYMQAILTHTSVEYQKHPIIVVDILPHFMSALLDYMYIGIVKIASNELTDFLAAAQKLKVQGLFVTVENLLRDAQIAQNAQNVQNAHNLRNLNSGALELAQMHTEYAIDRFSQQKCLPFVNQIRTFTENNCSNLRSPPTKRKRCLDSLDGGRRMVNTDSIPNVIQPIFNENSPVLNPALLNGPILPMHEHASLPTAPNDANEPTDFNPMPLVKVEMEDDAEANALEEGAVNTNGGESTLDMEEKKVPLVPEEHPTAPDDVSMPPLTVPGSDGEAIGSSEVAVVHNIHQMPATETFSSCEATITEAHLDTTESQSQKLESPTAKPNITISSVMSVPSNEFSALCNLPGITISSIKQSTGQGIVKPFSSYANLKLDQISESSNLKSQDLSPDPSSISIHDHIDGKSDTSVTPTSDKLPRPRLSCKAPEEILQQPSVVQCSQSKQSATSQAIKPSYEESDAVEFEYPCDPKNIQHIHTLQQNLPLVPNDRESSIVINSSYFSSNHSIFEPVGNDPEEQESLNPIQNSVSQSENSFLDVKSFAENIYEVEDSSHYISKTSYICSECGKSFVNSCTLTVHRRVHSAARPHKCPHCSYTAKMKHHVKQHIHRKHSAVMEDDT